MAEGIPDYDELKLRVEATSDESYRVLAFGPDGSTAQGRFVHPFSMTELENFVLRVGLPRRSTRASRRSHITEARRFGGKLFDALLNDDVREVYKGARRSAEGKQRGLRVTLSLTGVPELMDTPWEFLYEHPSFLSQSIYTPIVRSLDLKDVRPPRKVTLPVQILGMISRPRGFDNLKVEDEREKLERALGVAAGEGLVELSWLEGATLSELERRIGAVDEVHVLHYIGHGSYDHASGEGQLLLEDRHGNPHQVTGRDLGPLLYDELSLRLVVLNACEGARTSPVDPFSGVASSLVDFGIPAVIGMQFEITDEAAIIFAERLYSAVAQGFPVDAAVAHARKAISAAGNDVEFGTPVLFLRAVDARLFDIELGPVQAHRLQTADPPADFALELYQDPPDARPGEPFSWRLVIENVGASTLTDVVARKSDGQRFGGEADLGPGRRYTIRWPENLEADHQEVITVTARDQDGSLISEQIAAHAVATGSSSISTLTVREPSITGVSPQAGSPPRDAPAGGDTEMHGMPLFHPAIVVPLTPEELKLAGGFWYKGELATLLGALKEGERVYQVLAGSWGSGTGLVSLTDRRLVMTRSNGGVESVSLGRIFGAELTMGAVNHVLVSMHGGAILDLSVWFNQTKSSQLAGLLKEAIGTQSKQASLSPVPVDEPGSKGAVVQVIQRGDKVCALRIRVSDEEHTLKYEVGTWRDKVELDGQLLYQIWAPRETLDIALSDGERTLPAALKVSLNAVGSAIVNVTLEVAGDIVYSG